VTSPVERLGLAKVDGGIPGYRARPLDVNIGFHLGISKTGVGTVQDDLRVVCR
jgi:hypothetical protein